MSHSHSEGVAAAAPSGSDRGMVTLETALALSVVALVALVCVALARVGVEEVRLASAAREGVRLTVRGEPEQVVRSTVSGLAPGAALAVVATEVAGLPGVEVTLTRRLPLLPFAAGGPVWPQEISLTGVLEP